MAAPEIEGFGPLTEVGRGGFGVVYRARDERFGRDVAVKVLFGALRDDDARSRFERECRAAGSVSAHPNIVTVHGAGTLEDGRPYLVMEYLPEGSLADRLAAAGPVVWRDAVGFGVKLGGALETAHVAGIVHRDVKPENVLFTTYGEPCLGDFGVARVSGATETRTGVITASLHHVAPEILTGSRPTTASDVYSLASTVIAAILGRPPFAGYDDEPLAALVARIASQPPPDLVAAGCPRPVAAVLAAAVAKAPEDRPASALAFAQALRGAQREFGFEPTPVLVLGSEDAPTVAVPPVPEGITRRRDSQPTPVPDDTRPTELSAGRRPRVAVVGAVVATLLVGVVAFAFGRPGGGPGPTPSESPTLGLGSTDSPSPSEGPSSSSSPSPSASPSDTPSPGVSPSSTPSPGISPSSTPSPGISPSSIPSPGISPTPSSSPSETPGNQPPVLPAKSFTFEVPAGQWTTVVSDNRLSDGWSDPDGTASFLCLEFRPRDKETWGLDGANCEGAGLKVYADNPGTYHIDYVAKECDANSSCGPPYSTRQNTIRIVVEAGNQPPVLPAKSFTFEVPAGQWTTVVSDNRLSDGWSDPDGTASFLCLEFRPRDKETWGLDGANCEGAGLKVYATNPGTYYIDYVAKECDANSSCGPPYSTQQNTITIIVG